MGAVFFRDESDVEFSFHYVSRTDSMKSVMLFVTPETAVTEGESFVSLLVMASVVAQVFILVLFSFICDQVLRGSVCDFLVFWLHSDRLSRFVIVL